MAVEKSQSEVLAEFKGYPVKVFGDVSASAE